MLTFLHHDFICTKETRTSTAKSEAKYVWFRFIKTQTESVPLPDSSLSNILGWSSHVLSRLGKNHVTMNAVVVTAHLHWLHGDLHRFRWRHLLLFRSTSSCLSTAGLFSIICRVLMLIPNPIWLSCGCVSSKAAIKPGSKRSW